MRIFLIISSLFLVLASCDDNDDMTIPDNNSRELYFPDKISDTWETLEISDLGWNENELQDLYDFLSENNTRAFIILKDGKIVIEQYWGNNILNTAEFNSNTLWYWASAGKTITASLVGIAQKNNVLNIEEISSKYLGSGWTSLDLDKENLITIKNQLTMTTGLDYTTESLDCTDPNCLQYKADAGTQWYYHNAPYTLLDQVVSQASQTDYNTYTTNVLKSKIGMNGEWIKLNYNNVFWSTARDMARFGLLTLNKGKWENDEPLYDESFHTEMTTTSQNLNPSYGYLWWLNGKSQTIFPGFSELLNTPVAQNAPVDLYAGLGKNGQFLDIVPSQNLVIVRMGEAPEESLVPIQFHNDMWKKINAIINP